jgi:hypothetical protein
MLLMLLMLLLLLTMVRETASNNDAPGGCGTRRNNAAIKGSISNRTDEHDKANECVATTFSSFYFSSIFFFNTSVRSFWLSLLFLALLAFLFLCRNSMWMRRIAFGRKRTMCTCLCVHRRVYSSEDINEQVCKMSLFFVAFSILRFLFSPSSSSSSSSSCSSLLFTAFLLISCCNSSHTCRYREHNYRTDND